MSNHRRIKVLGVEFYRIIYNHPFWRVLLAENIGSVLVREDILPCEDSDSLEEIKYTVKGIPYRECKEENIPLQYLQMIRIKNDSLSRYEI